MITPRELIDLANDLCAEDREVAWRTAATCAYFAVFHLASELLDQAGFDVPNSEKAHGYLWLRLENSGHPDVSAAGMELKELRTRRNRAQYDRNDTFSHLDATRQVVASLRVMDLLEQVRESPDTVTRIIPVIRDYERDVLQDVTYRESP